MAFVRVKKDRKGRKVNVLVENRKDTGGRVRQTQLAYLGYSARTLTAAIREAERAVRRLRHQGARLEASLLRRDEKLRLHGRPTPESGARGSRWFWDPWEKSAKIEKAAKKADARLTQLCEVRAELSERPRAAQALTARRAKQRRRPEPPGSRDAWAARRAVVVREMIQLMKAGRHRGAAFEEACQTHALSKREVKRLNAELAGEPETRPGR